MIVRFFILAFSLLYASLAMAEWYNDYQHGIDMIKKKNWVIAISSLRNAIRQKDEEATIVNLYEKTYGDYYPHFYLAMAHFHSRQYREALAEFEKSMAFGAIQKNPELYQKLKDLRSVATSELSPKQPAVSAKAAPASEEAKQKSPSAATQTTQIEESPKVQPNEKAQEWIRIGAQKYFEGNFDDAIALLTQLLRQDPKNASAQFLLGCAYASKYLLSGSQDRDLFEKAAVAFQTTKRLDPDFAASSNPFISPAILQIYQQS